MLYALAVTSGLAMFAGGYGFQQSMALGLLGSLVMVASSWGVVALALRTGWYLQFTYGGAKARHVDEKLGGFGMCLFQFGIAPLLYLGVVVMYVPWPGT